MKRKYYFPLIAFFVLVFVFTSVEVFAQPGLPSAPSQAPIDGGLGLLAAAGGVYAYKKLRGKILDSDSDN